MDVFQQLDLLTSAQPSYKLNGDPELPQMDFAVPKGAEATQEFKDPVQDQTYGAQQMVSEAEKAIAFQVSEPDDSGKVTAQRGYVLCIDPKSSASPMMIYMVPSGLDMDPPAEFSVSDGESLVVKVETTGKDIFTAVSALVVATDIASTHAQPPPTPAGGTAPPPLDGLYYYRIADFVMEGGSLRTKQIHSGGVILHRPNLPEFYNLPSGDGTQYDVLKKWNATESRYELRPIVQLSETDGVPLLFPFQAGEPPYDAIKVRTIKGKDTLGQIRVRAIGGATATAITVDGNDVSGSAAINFDGSIQVEDGLVTTIDEGTRGSDFDLVNYPCVLDPGGPAPSPLWTIYFRKGLAFLADPGGAPTQTLVQYDGFSCYPADVGP